SHRACARTVDGLPSGMDDGSRLPRRVRASRQRAVHLAAAVCALHPAVLQLPPALLAAAPRPARAAVVLGVAGVLQPRAHLPVGAARLSAAAVPARADARARAPSSPTPGVRPAAPARARAVAGARRGLPDRLSYRSER